MPKLTAITQPLLLAKLAYGRLGDFIIHGQLLQTGIYKEMKLPALHSICRILVKKRSNI
jgi:hypothetical protein